MNTVATAPPDRPKKEIADPLPLHTAIAPPKAQQAACAAVMHGLTLSNRAISELPARQTEQTTGIAAYRRHTYGKQWRTQHKKQKKKKELLALFKQGVKPVFTL